MRAPGYYPHSGAQIPLRGTHSKAPGLALGEVRPDRCCHAGCLKMTDDAETSVCLSPGCADSGRDHAIALTDGKTGEPENTFYPATVIGLERSTPCFLAERVWPCEGISRLEAHFQANFLSATKTSQSPA